ncbi:hypothetical protein KSP40_PGU000333 [Platanthera guangdongensis]|uniref:DUF4704 domain-containing protein n=1 Tax=Platanthera guangdongensis TaxID=2320717 RepID=A0ABR2MYB0_9ASPA
MEDDPLDATAAASAPTLGGGSPSGDNRLMLELTSSSSSLNEEDLFEPVSLRDLDPAVPELNLADASVHSSVDSGGEIDTGGALTSEMNPDVNFYNHPIKSSSSTASLDSYPYASSSVGSPAKPRARHITLPDIPLEVMHLVDSVIMGRSDGMDKLKAMVSGVESLEVSRSVVDALLATMCGVEVLDEMAGTGFEESTPSVMLTSRAAVVAVELIPWLPWEGDSEFYMSPLTRLVKGLFLILNSCTRNRVMCSSSDLLSSLLGSTEKLLLDSTDRVRWSAWPLFYCLQILGGHSLSVIDLELWLNLIKKSIVSEWSTPLILALENAMGSEETRGPACTFEFDGDCSGLLAPGENRWPFSNGYAFVTWIYLDLLEEVSVDPSTRTTAADGASGSSKFAGQVPSQIPRIFSFVSADNYWVESYFYGQFLVVEIGAGKGKKSFTRFAREFKSQCWYFIGLEHSYKQSLLGKAESEIRLYVDGKLQEIRPFDLPRTSKPLSFCCIGSNPPPTLPGLQRRKPQCPLFGEMGPVYIFKEPIGPDIMARLASRGGDALPSFGSGAGTPWMAVNERVRSLAEESSALNTEIGGSLHLLYHPCLLNGQICPDASPSFAAVCMQESNSEKSKIKISPQIGGKICEASPIRNTNTSTNLKLSGSIQHRHAEVLGKVNVATRVRLSESLWALANCGPMALLPLIVSEVQIVSLEPKIGDLSLALVTSSLSVPVFRIISMAIQHPGNKEQLSRVRAPEVLSKILSYMLKIRSNSEVGKLIRSSDEDLVAAIASLCQDQKHNYPLKVQLFSTLLLDLKVWGVCSYGLQKKHLSSLADMVFTESSAMRDANALHVLLDGCRRCFWVIHENDCIDTFSLHGGPRPVGELNALVDELLVVIELLVGASSSSMENNDIRCLLGFLVDCPQPNQILYSYLSHYELQS